MVSFSHFMYHFCIISKYAVLYIVQIVLVYHLLQNLLKNNAAVLLQYKLS